MRNAISREMEGTLFDYLQKSKKLVTEFFFQEIGDSILHTLVENYAPFVEKLQNIFPELLSNNVSSFYRA